VTRLMFLITPAGRSRTPKVPMMSERQASEPPDRRASSGRRGLRVGYLVPEFPGQTHAFFWREIEALRSLGLEIDLVSTRPPLRALVSHRWAQQAIEETDYLTPLRPDHFASLLSQLRQSGRAGVRRCVASMHRAEDLDWKRRLRLGALAVAGGRLADMGRRRGWNHVHAHSCADAAQVVLFAHLLSGVSYSLTLHGPLEDYGPNQREKWRHAAFAIVITRRLLHEVERVLDGSLPARVEVAPMGVQPELFQRSEPYRPWPGRGPLSIFSCGRLNPAKGHHTLIGAVARLRERGLDAHLTIAGEDEVGGAGYRALLERDIALSGLQGSVALLGAVSEGRIRAELEAAHVFALASREEPLGVAIMEAMAMEVPIVATRSGGVPELVDDGVDGLLVRAESEDDMAHTLDRIARDGELASRIASAGRRKIEAEFSADRSAAVLAGCLEESLRSS
jgi:colanic acid/amylovoran biosynthesis glycosyltransferase